MTMDNKKRLQSRRSTMVTCSTSHTSCSADPLIPVSDTLLNAYNTILECSCELGCYKCVESPSCKSHNVVSSKLGAQAVLAAILGKAFDENLLPPPNNAPMDLLEELRTVVPAPGVGAVEGVFVETETKHEHA